MSDLHPIAKRIHNVQPRPVRLELDSGEEGVFEFSSTEFFQREFQGEGTRVDGDADAAFRLITSDDYERVLLGRSGPDEDGWSMLGSVVSAAADDNTAGGNSSDDDTADGDTADDTSGERTE